MRLGVYDLGGNGPRTAGLGAILGVVGGAFLGSFFGHFWVHFLDHFLEYVNNRFNRLKNVCIRSYKAS